MGRPGDNAHIAARRREENDHRHSGGAYRPLNPLHGRAGAEAAGIATAHYAARMFERATRSRWMCRAELEAAELVVILSDYQLDWVEVHAVYPGGRRPSLKVRTFSDYLAAQLMHRNEVG